MSKVVADRRDTKNIRWWGARDPSYIFDPFQVIAFTGLALYVGYGLTVGFGMNVSPLAVILTFATVFLPSLMSQLVDMAFRGGRATVAHGLGTVNINVVGTHAEVDRTLRLAGSLDPAGERFWKGISYAEQWALFALVLLVLPSLRVFGGVSSTVLSFIAMGAVMLISLQHASFRTRYRFDKGTLLVDHYFGFKLNETVQVPLAGAQITCDFGAAALIIDASGRCAVLNLRELWRPHRFVACVVATASSAPGPGA